MIEDLQSAVRPSHLGTEVQRTELDFGAHSCVPYYYGSVCVNDFASILSDAYDVDTAIVVTDRQVWALYGEDLRRAASQSHIQILSVFQAEHGEVGKTLKYLTDLCEDAINAGATRKTAVLTFGGGIPGNIGGVAAAMLYRGIRLFHFATTIVSAADSVISLKQAVNAGASKNSIGGYYAPAAIFSDMSLFATLSGRDIQSGIGEMAKNCLAIAPVYADELVQRFGDGTKPSTDDYEWLLRASIDAKFSVMKNDPQEKATAIVLEYGHTVGHAIELVDADQRRNEGISHGGAISIGMLVEAQIAADRGQLDSEAVDHHWKLLGQLGLPTVMPHGVEVDAVVDRIMRDNKRGILSAEVRSDDGHVPCVLLEDIGRPAMNRGYPLTEVEKSEYRRAISTVRSRAEKL